jgi:uncharacterized protein YndB with AHSA1/START domain
MTSLLSVTCDRSYPAPPSRVYLAFTEPELMRRWWSPDPDVSVEILEWTLRVGGAWRFAYRFPDGTVTYVRGLFQRVDPARRLVFTWTWEPPDVHAGIETLVSVTLAPKDRGTRLQVRHEGFPTNASRDRHDVGWSGTLERLPEVLQ